MSKTQYFSVTKHPDDNNANDIYFGVRDEDNEIDFPEKILNLKNDIEKFISTIQSVFKDDSDLFNKYYQRVFSLADLAFNSSKDQSKIAQDSLDKLKNEIIIEVGPGIRNLLLFNFLKLSLIPLLISILIVFIGDQIVAFLYGLLGDREGNYYISKLGLISIGAISGGWISMATSTFSFNYNDISRFLNNNKEILSRILFIIIFSICISIVMISGVLTINIGGLDSTNIVNSSSVALAFGFLIGLSDKIFIQKLTTKINKMEI